MKKIFTLFTASFLLILSVLATPYRGGKLTLINHNVAAIRVYLDGKRIPLEYNMLVLNDIAPGNHTIRIVERNAASSLPINREKVLYNGSVYFRNSYHVDIVVNRFGKTLIDEQEIRTADLSDNEDYSAGTENAMSDASFETLKNALRQEKFTTSRMAVAKQAISNNYFKTEQVKQLAQFFSFEDDRMQIAKQAYVKTIDRSNYYLLAELFSFTSNKAELARFITENGGPSDDGYSVKPIIGNDDFSKIKMQIAGTYADNAKLNVAKQSIDNYYFTAEQIKELVGLFQYETSRLDIAKYAYGRTVNKNNYYIINDLFNSKTSRDELTRYMANYR